jgi:hypothetical protein
MAEWRVQLQGEFDLRELKEILLGHDPRIIEKDSNFYLTSTDWDELQKPREVDTQAKEFIQLLENAAYVHFRDTVPLTIGGIVRIDDEGREHRILIAEYGAYTSTVRGARRKATATASGLNPIESRREHPLIKALRMSKKNPAVADALRFLRKGDWVSLYKAYEIVRDAVHGEQPIIRRGWLTEKARKRFTWTAQSREALGDEARHASRMYRPPKEPMSIHEARAIIADLLQQWIDSL